MLNSYIWFRDRTLSSVTTPALSGPESDDNEGVLHIPQRSSITRTSPSNCLVSYPGQSMVESYHATEMQSVYSPATAI